MIKNKCKKIVSAILIMTMIATTFSVDVFAGGNSSCVKVKNTFKDCCGEKEGQNLVSVGDISAVKVENNIKCDITFNGCCGCCCKKDDDNNKNCKPESKTENKGATDDKPKPEEHKVAIDCITTPVYQSVPYSTYIPSGVTSIADREFKNRKDLTSITIPDSVEYIGERAFQGCTGLTSITIPNSVTEIGEYAFEGCTGLTSITIPNSVTEIGKKAFANCTNLTSVTNLSNCDLHSSIKNIFANHCNGFHIQNSVEQK